MIWLSGRHDGHRLGELRARDGVVIPYREWWREKAKAVVLYLHGQGDHSGPFTAMGDLLHERGFHIYAHDHRGFGLSREARGDIPTFACFIQDALEVLHHARRQNGDRPVFLLGLSMGGHIALRTACRAGQALQGVIALSLGFKLRNPPTIPQVVRGVLSAILAPRRYLPILGEPVVTTRNALHVKRAQEDEHWVHRFTGRFLLNTVLSIKQAKRELSRLKLPVLMLQAGDDALICPEESRRFFERIPHPDKEFRLLPGLCHNLVAEPEMPEIASLVAAWMEARIHPPFRLM
jgi:alpha-beta hydrolase superfamily lysophospholipase